MIKQTIKDINIYLLFLTLLSTSNSYTMNFANKGLSVFRRCFSSQSMNAKKAYEMFNLDKNYKYSEADLKKIKLHLSKLYHPDLYSEPLFENNASKQFQNIDQALFHIKKIQELTDSQYKSLNEEQLKTILKKIEYDYKKWKNDIENEANLNTEKEESDKGETKKKKYKFWAASMFAGSAMCLLYEYEKNKKCEYIKSQEFIDVVKSNDIEKVKYFLADPNCNILNQIDYYGLTALHHAAQNNNTEMLFLLINDQRINLFKHDNNGCSAFAYINNECFDKVINVLDARVSRLIANSPKEKNNLLPSTDDLNNFWQAQKHALNEENDQGRRLCHFLNHYNKYRNEILIFCLENLKFCSAYTDDLQKRAFENLDYEMVLLLSRIYKMTPDYYNLLYARDVRMVRLIKKCFDFSNFNSKEIILEIIENTSYPVQLIEEYSDFYKSNGPGDFNGHNRSNLWYRLEWHCDKRNEESILQIVEILKKFAIKDVYLPDSHTNDSIKCSTLKALIGKIYQDNEKKNSEFFNMKDLAIKIMFLCINLSLHGMFSNKAFSIIRLQAIQALKKRTLFQQALRRNYLHTNNFLNNKSTIGSSLVEYTPYFSKVRTAPNKNLIYRESADFNFKNFPLIFASQQNFDRGRSQYIYIATSEKLNDKDIQLKKRIILPEGETEQTHQETQDHFDNLPWILRWELKRDINKNAAFFLKNSYSKTSNLKYLLCQLPTEFKSYYTNMIQDLASNQNFKTAHCIQMHTTFHCDENDQNLVTYIKTVIDGYGTSNENQDCCEKCEIAKNK